MFRARDTPTFFPPDQIMMLTPTQMIKVQEILRAINNEGAV